MERILLIDADAAFMVAACDLLMRQPRRFRVDTASNADGSLRVIRHHDYDVVVSDTRMPGLNGIQLLMECQRIRPNIPVVLLMTDHDAQLTQDAIRYGAYAFLHKPVDGDTFVSLHRARSDSG